MIGGGGVGYVDVVYIYGVDDVDTERLVFVLESLPPYLEVVGLDGVDCVSEGDIF